LASRSFLELERTFLTADTIGYVMPPQRSVDIDTLLDWQWAEFLMQQRQL
jgi:CMP-N,N'-diacetyllegionaminic acid synthase